MGRYKKNVPPHDPKESLGVVGRSIYDASKNIQKVVEYCNQCGNFDITKHTCPLHSGASVDTIACNKAIPITKICSGVQEGVEKTLYCKICVFAEKDGKSIPIACEYDEDYVVEEKERPCDGYMTKEDLKKFQETGEI